MVRSFISHILSIVILLTTIQVAFGAENDDTIIALDNQQVKTLEFQQIDIKNDTGEIVQANSPIGRLAISHLGLDLLISQLKDLDEIEKVEGYINVVIDGVWIARNIRVTRQGTMGSLAFKFDLGGIAGQNVSTIKTQVTFSEAPLLEAPATEEVDFEVISLASTADSIDEIPLLSDQVFEAPEETKEISQEGYSLVESATNQGLVSSFANALAFLENNTNLAQEETHTEGLAGDASLIGQLGSLVGRDVTSRREGEPVDARDGVEGLLKYLIQRQKINRVRTTLRGLLGNADIESELDGIAGIARGRSTEISYDNIYNALKRKRACIAGVGEGPVTRWSNIMAAGLTAGEPWMIHYRDSDESSDDSGSGQEGVSFTYLKPNIVTGRLTLYESGLELNHLFCLGYKEDYTLEGSLVPPATESYSLENLPVEIIVTLDEAGHICCVEIVPLGLTFTFEDGMLTVDGAAPWLPFIGVLNPDGSFNASSISTVAGFSNILSTITGLFDASGFNGEISLGVNGGLNNSGVPITWQVRVESKRYWPWYEKIYKPRLLKPSILANGLARRTILKQGSDLELALKLVAGDRTEPVDWWLAAEADGYLGFYDLNLGTFQDILKPVFQGPLTSIGYTTFLRLLGGLPVGNYKIHFYVDTIMNGQIDFDSLTGESFELIYKSLSCDDQAC